MQLPAKASFLRGGDFQDVARVGFGDGPGNIGINECLRDR